MDDVQEWSISLIEELKYILCNLDAGNVTEAHSVKAQNIDCTKARISSAQIQSLKADKIRTGTLDVSDKVTIKGTDGSNTMEMNAQRIVFSDANGPRIVIGCNGNKYVFEIYKYTAVTDDNGNVELDENGNPKMINERQIYIDENGDVIFCGTIKGGKIESDTDINVTKDAKVGRRVILQDEDEGTLGYEEAGIISVGNGIMQILAQNGRRIDINTGGNIDLDCKTCTINGVDILREIENLKEQLKSK